MIKQKENIFCLVYKHVLCFLFPTFDYFQSLHPISNENNLEYLAF